MEKEEEVVDATYSTDEQEVDNDLGDNEEVTALKKKLIEADEAKRQLTARAKRAEEEARTLKSKSSDDATQFTKKEVPSEEATAVMILQSQGMDDDSIAYLKKVAAVEGMTLIAAKSSDLFKAFTEKRESEEKTKKASLGASRGSGSVKKEKNITTPGLSDDDHKELWRKQMGQ